MYTITAGEGGKTNYINKTDQSLQTGNVPNSNCCKKYACSINGSYETLTLTCE